jgi:hypothetical protein
MLKLYYAHVACSLAALCSSKASNSSMASQAVTPEKIAPLHQRPSPKFSHSSSGSPERYKSRGNCIADAYAK